MNAMLNKTFLLMQLAVLLMLFTASSDAMMPGRKVNGVFAFNPYSALNPYSTLSAQFFKKSEGKADEEKAVIPTTPKKQRSKADARTPSADDIDSFPNETPKKSVEPPSPSPADIDDGEWTVVTKTGAKPKVDLQTAYAQLDAITSSPQKKKTQTVIAPKSPKNAPNVNSVSSPSKKQSSTLKKPASKSAQNQSPNKKKSPTPKKPQVPPSPLKTVDIKSATESPSKSALKRQKRKLAEEAKKAAEKRSVVAKNGSALNEEKTVERIDESKKPGSIEILDKKSLVGNALENVVVVEKDLVIDEEDGVVPTLEKIVVAEENVVKEGIAVINENAKENALEDVAKENAVVVEEDVAKENVVVVEEDVAVINGDAKENAAAIEEVTVINEDVKENVSAVEDLVDPTLGEGSVATKEELVLEDDVTTTVVNAADAKEDVAVPIAEDVVFVADESGKVDQGSELPVQNTDGQSNVEVVEEAANETVEIVVNQSLKEDVTVDADSLTVPAVVVSIDNDQNLEEIINNEIIEQPLFIDVNEGQSLELKIDEGVLDQTAQDEDDILFENFASLFEHVLHPESSDDFTPHENHHNHQQDNSVLYYLTLHPLNSVDAIETADSVEFQVPAVPVSTLEDVKYFVSSEEDSETTSEDDDDDILTSEPEVDREKKIPQHDPNSYAARLLNGLNENSFAEPNNQNATVVKAKENIIVVPSVALDGETPISPSKEVFPTPAKVLVDADGFQQPSNPSPKGRLPTRPSDLRKFAHKTQFQNLSTSVEDKDADKEGTSADPSESQEPNPENSKESSEENSESNLSDEKSEKSVSNEDKSKDEKSLEQSGIQLNGDENDNVVVVLQPKPEEKSVGLPQNDKEDTKKEEVKEEVKNEEINKEQVKEEVKNEDTKKEQVKEDVKNGESTKGEVKEEIKEKASAIEISENINALTIQAFKSLSNDERSKINFNKISSEAFTSLLAEKKDCCHNDQIDPCNVIVSQIKEGTFKPENISLQLVKEKCESRVTPAELEIINQAMEVKSSSVCNAPTLTAIAILAVFLI